MPPQKFTRGDSCQYHCTLCNLCFASLSAFDLHISQLRHTHRKPHKVAKLRLRTSRGLCKNMGLYRKTGREIWEHAEQADGARERFAELKKKRGK